MIENLRVKDIAQSGPRTLSVLWTDDQRDDFDAVELRRACPCASCIDEWTHEKILKAEAVPDNVRPIRIDSVGHYAMSIQFSDGHRTGIYTFKMLRDLKKKN